MEIRPTPDQEAFIRDAIEAGRIDSEERKRRRSEILAAVVIAQASTARGEGIEITRESMRELAEDVKRRGRARLADEQHEMPR